MSSIFHCFVTIIFNPTLIFLLKNTKCIGCMFNRALHKEPRGPKADEGTFPGGFCNHPETLSVFLGDLSLAQEAAH